MFLPKRPNLLICYLLITCVYLLPYKQLWAQPQQQPTVDQLIKQLETAKPDTNKVKLLDKLVDLYFDLDKGKARLYANQELELSQHLNWEKGLAMAYASLGWVCSPAENQQALDFFQQGYELAQKNGLFSLRSRLLVMRADIYEKLGMNDQAIQDYKSAIEFYLHSKEMYSANILPRWFIPAQSLLRNYSNHNKVAEGERFVQQILSGLLQEKDSLQIRTAYNLLWAHFSSKDDNKALKYALEWLKYFHSADTSKEHARTLTFTARTYTLIKNYVKALEYFQAAAALNPKGNPEVKSWASRGMRSIYETLGDYNKALNLDLQLLGDYIRLDYRTSWMSQQYGNVAEDYIQLKQDDQALLIISFFIARNYFNQRRSNKVISAEKLRSDNLLLNILPADVAEELKVKGSANARLFEEVTVLFTDFVNFTAIGELLNPQELVDELHYCFKAFDEIIGSYGIEKIKTIGDAYLAVAGLPNADPQHASNTVNAALEIRQFIHDRKQQMGNRSFNIRIGIHSGSVVAGIVGVKKFAYDIWGDTVNTAARMEQNSSSGQINLSEKTYELVKDRFAFTYRGEIEAKNKGALKMYFVEKQSAGRIPKSFLT